MKIVYSLFFVFLLANSIFGAEVFTLSGGGMSYKYTIDSNQSFSVFSPTVGLGIEFTNGNARGRLVLDAMLSYHTHTFFIHSKNRYLNMWRVDCDLLYKYKFFKKTSTSPFVLIGGYWGLIIPIETDANGDKIELENELDIMYDYGPLVGAGIEFFFGGFSLILEGRYRFGLGAPKLDEIKIHSDAALIMVAIKIL